MQASRSIPSNLQSPLVYIKIIKQSLWGYTTGNLYSFGDMKMLSSVVTIMYTESNICAVKRSSFLYLVIRYLTTVIAPEQESG